MSFIHTCCPDCGSTNIMHNSWCRVHLTPQNHPNLPLDPNTKKNMKKSLLNQIDLLDRKLQS